MSRNVTALGSRRHRWPLIAAVLFTLLWLAGTHLPRPDRLGIDVGANDKTVHAMGFAFLAVWWTVSARLTLRARLRRAVVGVVLGMAAFAMIDELTQPWFGRTAQWADWGADLLGAFAGTAVASAAILVGGRPA